MFPDSIPDTFSLGRTKQTYILVHALGPYFHEKIVSDMDLPYYSLQYDETTNNENVKELQVLIKFWSKCANKVVVHHLETFFIGKATADILKEKIKEAVNNVNLSLNYIIMLASDGPNVNKAVFRSLSNEIMQHRSKPLLDVGTCNIHSVHNAFSKALHKLGIEMSDFIIMIHSFIYDFPKRREEFESIQDKLKLPAHRLKKHVESRWLTLEEGCVVTIEQLPAIKDYFLNYIPKKVTNLTELRKYKAISNILKSPTFEAELNFVANSAKLFSGFTKLFQRNEPLIHILFEEMHRLVITIINRVCKKITKPAELFLPNNLLPLGEIILSKEITEKLASVGPRDSLSFRKKVQEHYIAACEYLLEKTVLNSKAPQYIVKNFRFLLPSEMMNHKQRNIEDMMKIIEKLPLSIPIDETVDELKVLQRETTTEDEKLSVIDFWTKVFQARIPGTGELKFPNLTVLVKVSLLVYHGSADVERSFSESSNMLAENQACMSVELLNAKLNIRSALKYYNNKPELVPITNDMMRRVGSAYSVYKAFLDKKKEEEEIAKKKSEEEKRIAEEEKKKKQEINENKKSLLELEEELKSQKKDLLGKRKVYKETIDLGNKKLKKALDLNNLTHARVAQAIISSAASIKAEEDALEKKKVALEKKILKLKNQLIKSI